MIHPSDWSRIKVGSVLTLWNRDVTVVDFEPLTGDLIVSDRSRYLDMLPRDADIYRIGGRLVEYYDNI